MRKRLAIAGVAALFAAGSASASDTPVETAQAMSAPVRIEIVTTCRNDDAVFVVRNHGESWPASARLLVLRTVDGRVIKIRRTKISSGEEADIVIRGAAKTGVEVALKIDAAWADFSEEPVSRIRCVAEG